jgi:glycosyltransferase involved in cell wall biosynthesis
MISLILPYWMRRAAADKALYLLDQQYHEGVDLELVIVDDGNPIPYIPPRLTLNTKVVRLPVKSAPTPQSVAWNAGVAAASGDIIVLSCIEMLHDKGQVLQEMAARLDQIGPNGYVLAAAWCPEQRAWHCHSSVKVPDCPDGSGIAYLGMMRRELFERAGGFDEDYRDGAGYEDRDFIRRMARAGAIFNVCDDLVVTHPKTNATILWPGEGFARNAELFRQKWGAVTC